MTLRSGLKTLSLLLIFGLVGGVIGLRTVATATLPHILSPNPGLDYQNVVDGLPVPRLLNWNQGQLDALTQLRDLNGPGLFLAAFALYSLLGEAALRALNPTFRLFRVKPAEAEQSEAVQSEVGKSEDVTPKSPSASPALNAAIEPDGLIRAALILLALGLPVALCWLALGRWDSPVAPPDLNRTDVGRWSGIWAARLALLGIATWIGFHPLGLAGTGERRTLNMTPRTWPKLGLVGALFGLVAFAVGRYAVPGVLEPILLRYQTLGTFNVAYWHEVVGRYLLCMACAWCAVAALFVLLAGSTSSKSERLLLVFVAIAAILVARTAQIPFRADQQAARWDLNAAVLRSIPFAYRADRPGSGIPFGPQAADQLAGLLHFDRDPKHALPERSVLIFNDDGNPYTGQFGTHSVVRNVTQRGGTLDGLQLRAEDAAKSAALLRKREYRSALSWVATRQRVNTALYRFDTTAALAACLDDISYGPHGNALNPLDREYSTPVETVQALFFICAVTPENLGQLHRWADLNRFAFPDRQSKRLIGDLYRRFGDVKHALLWYRYAEMPHTFMARIAAEQPLFHTGHVTGILRLNGRPLAGVQVGLVPSKLNGVPKPLEGPVHMAIEEINADRRTPPDFEPYHPAPIVFRWVSGSTLTDAGGRFTLDGLTEGEYHLLCTLPPGVSLEPPIDPNLRIGNAPLPFNVHYGNQSVNLGIIDLYR